MQKQESYNLKPFVACSIKVQSEVRVDSNGILNVSYLISDPNHEALWPKPEILPHFEEGLWEQSCCELFLGVKDDPRYLEFNFAPNLNWAVFAFNGPRLRVGTYKLAPPIGHFFSKPCELQVKINLLECELLGWALLSGKRLEINICAILATQSNQKHYFAIKNDTKPDFHNRKLWSTIDL
jgi:hypothetical protein